MLATSKEYNGDFVDYESTFNDSRLTEISDSKRYDYRKAIERMHKLGRPLTENEAKEFELD